MQLGCAVGPRECIVGQVHEITSQKHVIIGQVPAITSQKKRKALRARVENGNRLP